MRKELATHSAVAVHESGIHAVTVGKVFNLSVDKDVHATILLRILPLEVDTVTIEIAPFAEVELIELYEDDYASHPLNISVKVRESAHLKHHMAVTHGQGKLVNNHHVVVEKFGDYTGNYIDFGSIEHKGLVEVQLQGEDANVYWRVAAVSAANDKKEFQFNLHNEVPHTTVNMDLYGLVRDNGKLTFIGSGHIVKDAVMSATHQTSKIIIFDEASTAISEPNLYIDENDVEASHSSGIGKIDDEQLFYLCSRGITPDEAKRQITLGYLVPAIDLIDDSLIRGIITERMEWKIVTHD